MSLEEQRCNSVVVCHKTRLLGHKVVNPLLVSQHTRPDILKNMRGPRKDTSMHEKSAKRTVEIVSELTLTLC